MTDPWDRTAHTNSQEDSSDSRPVTDGGNRDGNQPRGQQGGNQPRGQQGGNQPRGQQGGNQPRGQQPQGGQPRGQGQSQPQSGRPPQGGRGQPAGGGDESRFTRRQLLAGGGAAVAAGAGGWFFFLRGPSGAKGLSEQYVNAVSNNDWSSAEALFHSDAPVSQQISQNDNVNDYEGYLEQNGQLSQLENLNPSVQNHVEFAHYPDYNQGTAEDVGGFQLPGADNAGSANEAKIISTIIEVDISTYYDDDNSQAEHLSGDTTNVGMSVAAVLNGGDWSIWSTQGI